MAPFANVGDGPADVVAVFDHCIARLDLAERDLVPQRAEFELIVCQF